MSFYSIYFSPTGGTKRVADILAVEFEACPQEIDLCRETEPLMLTEDDICLVSVPSYGGRVPAVALERMSVIDAKGAKAVLVCVYGNREWEDTLTELQDTLEACGIVCVVAVAAVAEHSIFRQFAAGRPDEAGAAELRRFAAAIREKLGNGHFSPLELEGSHGQYKAFGGVPFKPEGDRKCVACGVCAEACPVSAIDNGDPRKTDKDKCISCMRCVSLCPKHARDLNKLVMKGAAAAMAPKLGGHKENHLFL